MRGKRSNARSRRLRSPCRIGPPLNANLRALLLVVACIAASWLLSRSRLADATPATKDRLPGTAVVFSGDFRRIDAGLTLLAEHDIQRLFVSGVNGGAGLSPQTFVRQFAQRNPQITDLPGLVNCCVAFGLEAKNTFQNAAETRCWLDRANVDGPVLLITSRSHLPRALLALSASIPSRRIIAYPIEERIATHGALKEITNFTKLVGASVLIHAPWLLGVLGLNGSFNDGCPA